MRICLAELEDVAGEDPQKGRVKVSRFGHRIKTAGNWKQEAGIPMLRARCYMH